MCIPRFVWENSFAYYTQKIKIKVWQSRSGVVNMVRIVAEIDNVHVDIYATGIRSYIEFSGAC